MLPFPIFVSLRYLRAKRKQFFISIITVISIAGVTLGVASLMVVLSVMNGFDRDLKNKILGTRSHLHIGAYSGGISQVDQVLQTIGQEPGVVAASPYVTEQAMLRSKYGASGAVVTGLDFQKFAKITDIPKMITLGKRNVSDADGKDCLVLGVDLAARLGVSLGDPITLITPHFIDTASGPMPRMAVFKVAAIFDAGMYEYNSTFVYLPLGAMQKVMQLGQKVQGIEIKVEDVYKAKEIGSKLIAKLGTSYWYQDWMSINRNIFSALALEKVVMFLIMTIIILVAAFNILSSLVMVVMEKTKEIGILKALGATHRQVMGIFIFNGSVIGAAGTLLGVILGSGLCWALDKYQFIKLPGDVYYLTTLPVYMKWEDTLVIILSALVLSFVATIYPAWQASRLDPVEAIRYE